MNIKCPKCGLECDGEAPNKPWFYHCECDCGFEFCYNDYSDTYYDVNGNEIIAEEEVEPAQFGVDYRPLHPDSEKVGV